MKKNSKTSKYSKYSKSHKNKKGKKIQAGSSRSIEEYQTPAQLTPYFNGEEVTTPLEPLPISVPMVPLPISVPMVPVPMVPVAPIAPIFAPVTRKDPRFLGKGSSKMIWLLYPDLEMDRRQLPRMDKVMVNALDIQLLKNGSHSHIFEERIEEQKNEFYFTRMVRQEFPDLIPQVYELENEDIYLPQPRFRYTKDRCEPLPKNKQLFDEMIRISDRIINQGWVYLDMKPGNLGLFEGRVLLIDTDPVSFYRLPPVVNEGIRQKMVRFYRESCHMIILLFCLNHVSEIEIEVLQEFIRSNGYTEKTFREIYDHPPIPNDLIADHNNLLAISNNYPVHVEPREIMPPKTFLRHYGIFEGLHPLTRLQQLIDYIP